MRRVVTVFIMTLMSTSAFAQETSPFHEQAPDPEPASAPEPAPQPQPAPSPTAPPNTRTPATVEALDLYHANELGFQYSYWRGLRVFRGSEDIGLNSFGTGYRELFAGSPAAIEELALYRGLRISGLAIAMVGIGALVAELVTLIFAPRLFIDSEGVTPLFWGLFIGGSVVGIAGAGLMGAATGPMVRGVNYYNEDLYGRIRAELGAPLTMTEMSQ